MSVFKCYCYIVVIYNLPRVIYSLEEKNIKRNNILRWDLSLEHQGLICSLPQSIMNRTTLLTTASLEHREVKKIMLSSTGLETENPSCDLSSIFRAKSKLKLCRPRSFFFFAFARTLQQHYNSENCVKAIDRSISTRFCLSVLPGIAIVLFSISSHMALRRLIRVGLGRHPFTSSLIRATILG